MAKLKAGLLLEAHQALVDLHYTRDPRRGRGVAEARANAQLGEAGRRRVVEAEKRVARKAAKRRARESAIRAQVTESLTAAQVPLAAPGTGAAPDVQGSDGGLMGALSTGRESPFWGVPGGAAVTGAPSAPRAGLHTLGSDELRDFSKSAFAADARARGFGSPVWG